MRNITILNCESGKDGGAVCNDAKMTEIQGWFCNNTAAVGGAIYCNDKTFINSSVFGDKKHGLNTSLNQENKNEKGGHDVYNNAGKKEA